MALLVDCGLQTTLSLVAVNPYLFRSYQVFLLLRLLGILESTRSVLPQIDLALRRGGNDCFHEIVENKVRNEKVSGDYTLAIKEGDRLLVKRHVHHVISTYPASTATIVAWGYISFKPSVRVWRFPRGSRRPLNTSNGPS